MYLLLGTNNIGLSYVAEKKGGGNYRSFSIYYRQLSEEQQKGVIKILIDQAKQCSIDDEYQSIIKLLESIEKNGNVYLEMLKEGLISLDIKYTNGLAPIHFAAQKGSLELVKYLVNAI